MKSNKLFKVSTALFIMMFMIIFLVPYCVFADIDESDINLINSGDQSNEIETTIPKNRLEINYSTSNGSLDYVEFKDENGNPLNDVEISLVDGKINVILPKDYSINGKVTAEFSLTQNGEGFPYVTSSNKASGPSSSTAWGKRNNIYTVSLSKGTATQTLYLYNHIPKATTNKNYQTYVINYKIKNEIPLLRENIEGFISEEIVAGVNYEVNLDDIFYDKDSGDILNYSLKINNENAKTIDANYIFNTKVAGEYVLIFTANDGKDSSEETYTVTLNVTNSKVTYNTIVMVPYGITPKFNVTSGFDSNGYDICGENLSAVSGESENNFVSYMVSVPENVDMISVRATKNNSSLGGMSIKVSGDTVVSFREVYIFIPTIYNENYLTSSQVEIDVIDENNHYATVGKYKTDEDGMPYYTFFLAATGNEKLYTFCARPLNGISNIYAKTEAKNKTVTPGDSSIYETTIELSYKSAFKLNVPSDAEAKVFYQNKNYNTSEVLPLEKRIEDDGSMTYYFNVPSGNIYYSYRVSKKGKITKAGYIKGDYQKVVWNENDLEEDAIINYDKETTLGARADDSLLMNVNAQNRIVLEKNNTYRLRLYRIWQIINNDTQNVMIEPDFKYTIISGDNIISINPITTGNGNAKNNWLDITASGDGVAILEVEYNALDILTGNVSGFNALNQFTFGASDKTRTGLVIIQIIDAATDVDFGIKNNKGTAWDAEFDTLYFTKEYGTIDFTPTVLNGSITKVEYSNDKGLTWTECENENNCYTAKIIDGNNIIKITKDDGTSAYQVLRGNKIDIKIENKTNSGENLQSGDIARITFEGLHFSAGKMSGIYNPGYTKGQKIVYTFSGENIKTKEKYQYDFLTNAYIEVTIPADAESGDVYILTNGHVEFDNMGSLLGAHRNITDSGAPTNMSATSTLYYKNILPDIEILIVSDIINNDNVSGDSGSGDNDNVSGDNGSGDINNDNPSGDSDNDRPGGNSGSSSKPDDKPIDVSNLKFDISGKTIKGYVTISFEDFGERKKGESGIIYKNQLGEIIEEVKVPFKSRDTIAAVTLRLLKALDIEAGYTGNATSDFYLLSIGNFDLNGKHYESFGEFDAGASSGWMVKQNNWFINKGASEFFVEDGDIIEWVYTCHLGADIGCDWSNTSAEITGIKFKSNYGKLSPAFDEDIEEYVYTISSTINAISFKIEQENYWAKATYKVGEKSYKPMEKIDVQDGTIIKVESIFSEYAGAEAIDSDTIVVTIRKVDSKGNSVSNIEEKEEEIPITFDENTFNDIKKDDWYFDAIKYTYENKLMKGTGNGFEPNKNMTRAMLVTVLYRLENPENKTYKNNFVDVKSGDWYFDAISWAFENDLIKGVGENEFAPNKEITREQMAVIIYRYSKLKEYNINTNNELNKFVDSEEINEWALDAMKWANEVKLIQGTSEITLSPKESATRAQVATILMRFCESVMDNN